MQQMNQPPAAPSVQQPGQSGLKPHRGVVVLVLGILGLIPYFICCILGTIPSLVCSIIAWVMATNDLKEMDSGVRDPSGRGMTKAGKICGIIGVIIQCIFLVISLVIFILAAVASTAAQSVQ